MPSVCVPQSPVRANTTAPKRENFSKRIIICCDGTWQDGIVMKKRWQYTNVLKLSRMFNHQDDRGGRSIPQIVFYQGGVGSEQNIYSEYIEGATGLSLREKVQEAYAFLAHNYQPGDDVYLFGFSRGAYTARMVAALMGEIGILDKKDMDSFADIFLAYQKRDNPAHSDECADCEKILAPFTNKNAPGIQRADPDGDGFTIDVLGVFDTVGSVGLPEELSFTSKAKKLLGFHDKYLGTHIHNAYHAMALDETRADFDVSKFEQTQKGKDKKQVLKQVWFPGSHSDVGGGWHAHDLADLALAWMASNIEDKLSLDYEYLRSIPKPIAAWGKLIPHDSQTGIFKLGRAIQRTLPAPDPKWDDQKKQWVWTHESIHPSVMYQPGLLPEVEKLVKTETHLFGALAPLEEWFKDEWPYLPGDHVLPEEVERAEKAGTQALMRMAKKAMGMRHEAMDDEGGRPRYDDNWLGAVLHELR